MTPQPSATLGDPGGRRRAGADNAESRALFAFALTRACGLGFFPHFLGLGGTQPPRGKATLVTAPELGRPGHMPSTAVAGTLADLSLGSAIRSQCGRGELLATTSLGIRVTANDMPKQAGLRSRAQCVFVDARTGIATCEVDAGEETIAACSARFLRSRPGDPPSLMPWEQDDIDDPSPLSRAELSSDELHTLEWVLGAAGRSQAGGNSLVDELLAVEPVRVAPDQVDACMVLRPEFQNRAGALQGGTCFGAAATTAQAMVADFLFADGQVHYLRPVVGESVSLRARLVHRGRSSATIAVSVYDAEKTHIAATGLFTFLADPAT